MTTIIPAPTAEKINLYTIDIEETMKSSAKHLAAMMVSAGIKMNGKLDYTEWYKMIRRYGKDVVRSQLTFMQKYCKA